MGQVAFGSQRQRGSIPLCLTKNGFITKEVMTKEGHTLPCPIVYPTTRIGIWTRFRPSGSRFNSEVGYQNYAVVL